MNGLECEFGLRSKQVPKKEESPGLSIAVCRWMSLFRIRQTSLDASVMNVDVGSLLRFSDVGNQIMRVERKVRWACMR